MVSHSLLYRLCLGTFLLPNVLLSTAAPLLIHQVDELASPHTPTVDRRQGAGSTIPIVGITEFGVQPRLEIRDLESSHPDQWNIYLLGLARFQATDESDELSYYHVAGNFTSRPARYRH